MAAPEGWTIVSQPGENSNSIVSISSEYVVKDIYEYFDVVGDVVRKCKLCQQDIRLNASKSCWNLKSHLMARHLTEWTKLEPFLKKLRSEEGIRATANEFELIPPEEAKVMENCLIVKEERPKGTKRAKFMDGTSEDSSNGDGIESANGTTRRNFNEGHGSGDDCSQIDFMANDEFTIFGFFVANELRNLKTDHFRGELKRAIQKSLFEVAEKEAAASAVKRN